MAAPGRAMDRQDLHSIWDFILLISPAPIGALIGLRYAKTLTPIQQTSNFLCSLIVGYFSGALVGDIWPGISHNAVALATVVATAMSMEIMAGLLGIARAFSSDPFGAATKILDIVGRIFRRGAP